MFYTLFKCVPLRYLVCCEIVRPADVNVRAGWYRAERLLRKSTAVVRLRAHYCHLMIEHDCHRTWWQSCSII